MILVATYSVAARRTLRNVCRSHEECVVRRFGRAVLFEETELAAFLGLRLRERYEEAVQVERTRPLDAFGDVSERVRLAARAYENRSHPNTPYTKFAAGTDHPSPAELAASRL